MMFTDQELQNILILFGKADPLELNPVVQVTKDKIQAYFVAKQQEQTDTAPEEPAPKEA